MTGGNGEFGVSTQPGFEIEKYYATDAYGDYLEAGARKLQDMALITGLAFSGTTLAMTRGLGAQFLIEFAKSARTRLVMDFFATYVRTAAGEVISRDSAADLSDLSPEDLDEAQATGGLVFIKTDDSSSVGLAGPCLVIQG